jgi:hypothetical protein
MAWSLAGAALLLALGQGVGAAATITVTTNNPNIAADGQCSLIEAIVNANNDAAIHADCPAGSGADTIVLPANADVTLSNVYVTLYSGTRSVGLPLITSRITIEGNGATIARRGNAPDFALMSVRSAGDLTIHNATLSGGSSRNGSGVSNGGTLSIQNSTISGNTGSSVANGGTLTIENSTISNNTSNFGGSGIVSGGTLTIKNSTISDNTSNFSGGGVFNGGTLTIENSTISNNRAKRAGGGLFNYGGRLTITNSTISGNIANQGGGVSNVGFCYQQRYDPYRYYCYSATLTLSRSLIAGNQAAVGPEIENNSIVTANNFNLFGTNDNPGVSGFTPGPTDIVPRVSLAQILGPLQSNGGPTQTHALVPGSPAIDAGDPDGCRDNSGALLLKDQRGFTRHIDGNNDGSARCDIGAIEFGAGSATLMDLDGDGITDIGVYRDGTWFIRRSSDEGLTTIVWGGAPQDIPVPGDYDGDGKTDIALYRDGTWFIRRSSDNLEPVVIWGGAPQDIPVPRDYDGDGKADIAVYRDGTWFIIRSSDGGQTTVGWGGLPQDVPVPADFDGDGKADVAVYRDGTWLILRSSDGAMTSTGWGGAPEDIPLNRPRKGFR